MITTTQKNSHFLPALIKKIHELKLKIKNFRVMGNGKTKRELIFVDDLADAISFAYINKRTDKLLIMWIWN